MNLNPFKKSAKGTTGDSLQNTIIKVGASSKAAAGTYVTDLYITRQWVQLNALYRSNWLTKRIINLIADDMTREWTDISSEIDPKAIKSIQQYEKALQVRHKFNLALKWSRLYGGAILLMDFGSTSDPGKPIDPRVVKSAGLKAVHAIDRWQLTPSGSLVDDSASQEYGLPTHYIYKGQTLHHSRCIRLIPGELPYIESYRENHWSSSELEAVFNTVRKYDTMSDMTMELALISNLRYIGVDGLRDKAANGSIKDIIKLFSVLSEFANNNRYSLIDKDDTVTTQNATFAGLSDILQDFMTEVSGACEIPLSKLWGQSIRGLNSTGDGEIRQYYDSIRAKQQSLIQTPLDKLYACLVPSTIGKMPDDFAFEFKSLWQLSDKETAEIGYQNAQRDSIYLTAGVVTEKEVKEELKQRGTYDNLDTSLLDDPSEKDDGTDSSNNNDEGSLEKGVK